MLSELLINIDRCLRLHAHKHRIRVRDVPYYISILEAGGTVSAAMMARIMHQHQASAYRWILLRHKQGMINRSSIGRYSLTATSTAIAMAAIAELKANDIVAGSLRFKF